MSNRAERASRRDRATVEHISEILSSSNGGESFFLDARFESNQNSSITVFRRDDVDFNAAVRFPGLIEIFLMPKCEATSDVDA